MNPVPKLKLSGNVWGTHTADGRSIYQQLPGVQIEAFRSNGSIVPRKQSGPNGRYVVEYPQDNAPIEMVTYSHTQYHHVVLYPLAGVESHEVSPVLLKRGEKLTPAYTISQLLTYEFILGYVLHVVSDAGRAGSAGAIQAAMELVSQIRSNVDDLRDDVPVGNLHSTYLRKIQQLTTLCENILTSPVPLLSIKLIEIAWLAQIT